MRKDRLLIKGKPTGTAKDEIVLQHLINKHSGKPIPYFIDEQDGRLKYLDKKTTDQKTGVITYGYNDLTKKLEREARYQAEKLKLTPQLDRFQRIFGKVKGQQIFIDELAKNDAIFNANNPDLYDIDHMGSKKFKYPHMARNFNPQLSADNRGEGARLLTSEQETALRVLRNDLDNTIQLQGPELTQAQKDRIMGRTNGGKTAESLGFEFEQKKNEKLFKQTITDANPPPKTKLKANRLFQVIRHGARVAGQSPNPIANVGGDVVGVVMDGAAFLQDPKNPENVTDLALSGGQMAANLVAAGLTLVPGAQGAAYIVMKGGDNLGKIERIWNMMRPPGGYKKANEILQIKKKEKPISEANKLQIGPIQRSTKSTPLSPLKIVK